MKKNYYKIIDLYKKINQVIRKLSFSNALAANDSFRLQSDNDYANNDKLFRGPIAANTVYIDTITDCKLNFYNLQNKSYTLGLTLNGYKTYITKNYILSQFDEQTVYIETTY